MSRWRNLKPSSSGNVGEVERISSLRTSVARCDSTAGRTGSGERTATSRGETPRLRPTPLNDQADVAVERVDARLQKRVDGGRDDDLALAAVFAHHREHSSTKSGLPADADVIRSRSSGSSGASVTRRSMAPRTRRCQRLEQERRRIELPATHLGGRPGARARDAEQEDRRIAREVGDVLDEVDEDRLGPLQIVDNDDLRAVGCPRFEEPTEGELGLRRGGPDDRVGLDADRDQDLHQRPVGDPLAVREAPPAQESAEPPTRRGSRRRAATCRCPPGRGK